VSTLKCTLSLIIEILLAAPVIDPHSLSIVKANIGDSLTLSCTSRGSPPDTFTWRKERGSYLQPTHVTKVTHTKASAVFLAHYTIKHITSSHSGIYTCTVTNPMGSDSETIAVVASKLLYLSTIPYCTF